MHILHLNQRNQRNQILFQYLRDKKEEKKGGENSPISPPLDPRLANTFGLLTDEVCDITNIEQLVTFIKFVDVNLHKATTQFIAIDDFLKDLSSANATTIKNTVMKQLQECGLDVKRLSGLATDGCSVSQLRQESPLLLNVHCICHRLALACGDANNVVIPPNSNTFPDWRRTCHEPLAKTQ